MSDDPVRVQYEAYPYPARDPRDEAKRLVTGSPSYLAEANHYLFGGRRDTAKPFRALVAGGGTGDGTIMLAQQLADAGGPAQVVYTDLSSASRAIAEARAKARGLTDIRFESLSILDLPGSGLGPFDYIDCCGVLHHLEDPAAGLKALEAVLAPEGGIGMMLYGELGRIGVYHVQGMLGLIDDGAAPGPDRLALARKLLAQLPPTHWLKRNPFVGDHLDGTDAGLYDLLLHRRDRAYRVPEIAALARSAGLEVAAFVEPARYDPAAYLSDARLLERTAALPYLERAAFAELLAGNLRKHVFYLARPGRTAVADPYDLAAVPVLRDLDGAAWARAFRPGGSLTANVDGIGFRFPLPNLAGAMVARMEGRRLADIQTDLGLDEATFIQAWTPLYRAFNGLSKLYLSFRP
ncbi:MAG: class I SAM-dependent methyltransferase [Magnetospirillum sp. WYHS-4]